MQQHASTYMSFQTCSTLWVRSKVKNIFFLKVVIFHIKLMGMERRAPCKHKFYPYTRPRSLVGLNMLLLIVVMLYIKLKEIEHINFKTVFP